MILIFDSRPIIGHLFEMEIAENKENNTTNPINNPPPSTHHSRVVYIVYVFEYTFQHEQVKKKGLSSDSIAGIQRYKYWPTNYRRFVLQECYSFDRKFKVQILK